MHTERNLQPTPEDKNIQTPHNENGDNQHLSPGEIKVNEYVKRIQNGESKELIFAGLPESFKTSIEDRLIQSSEEDEKGIPPQYKGLNSEILDEIWIIPEYIDPDKTKEAKDKKAKAVATLKARELLEAAKMERQTSDKQKITELRRQLGVETPAVNQTTAVKAESSPTHTEAVLLDIEERKKLNGWSASYELAKIAKQQGVDLSTLSREEYVDYAIKNFLAIDDSQLRMSPWQRMCESPQEIIAINREKRASIKEGVDEVFNKFCFEMQKKAAEDDRSIKDRIRVRQGTKDSNSWLFFKINDGITPGNQETFKSYVSVKDLNTLTPERFIDLMVTLRDAGYNGDVKIFQDLTLQGLNLNDQIVMHGASEDDAKLALSVAEVFFGDDLDQESLGKDEVINGKNHSYSQVLAEKIKATIKQS